MTPPKSCSVVTEPQPNAILINFSSCGSSHMIKYNKSTVVSVRSATVSWFCVRPTSKRWFLKIIQVTMKHKSIWCHVGIHVDFTSILHSLVYSVGPSSIVWSELGPAPPSPSIRVHEVYWSRALSLVCEVNLMFPLLGSTTSMRLATNEWGEPTASYEMNQLSLRNKRLKFKTWGKNTDRF